MAEGKGTELKTVVRVLNIICGIGLIGVTIFQMIALGFLEFWNYINYIYWIFFGLLICAAEFDLKFILKYFSFLEGKFGKGWFLIFAGTWLIGDITANQSGGLVVSITGFVLVGCGFITMFLLSCSVINIQQFISLEIIQYNIIQSNILNMGNTQQNQPSAQSITDAIREQVIPQTLSLNLLIKKPFRVSKEYQFLTPPIGKGVYSEIRKVINKKTGIMRAMKIIQKNLGIKEEERIQNEIKVLEKLDHPNILKINEYFQDERFHYLITEYYSGQELFNKIETQKQFTEQYAAQIMHQILYAVHYCHLNKIMHRDIRPENIVFDRNNEDSHAILIDFGSCGKFDTHIKTEFNHPYFQAPEMQIKQHGPALDVWACGILMYVLLCGYPPFRGKTNNQIKNSAAKSQLEFDDVEWNKISKEAKDLIIQMLHKDPTKRITIRQALSNIWMVKYQQNNEVSIAQLRRVLQNMIDFKPTSKLQEATVSLIVLFLTSREEISELRYIFKYIDHKLDGIIDEEEMMTVLTKVYQVEDAEKHIQNLCKNTYLTYTQFLTRAIDRKVLLQKNKVETAFKLIDRNGSGTISVEELKESFKINSEFYRDPWTEIMLEVDINHDGSLSLIEFNSMMKKLVTPDVGN